MLRIDADGAAHWCINVLSGGFGAQISATTNTSLKQHLGRIAYLLTGIAELGKVQVHTALVRAPEGFEWKGEFIALACGNGRQAGGGHPLCPDACIDDGLLDVTILPPPDGNLLATLGSMLRDGTVAALEQAAIRMRSQSVEICVPQTMTYTLDGEASTASLLRIDCVAKRLRLHLPLGCPLLSVSVIMPLPKYS